MLQDEKLLNEHQIVVDDLCSRLKNLGTVTKGALQVLKLPLLSHLYTPIEVRVKDQIFFEDVVKKMHPTPALGGFPKEQAWKWLSNYDSVISRAVSELQWDFGVETMMR